ncbi:MAG: hypothetical protein AAF514_11545 [Verrucomicrobiota bacterium]
MNGKRPAPSIRKRLDVERLSYPVLAVTRNGTTHRIAGPEPLQKCRYRFIRKRFFDGLHLLDADGRTAAIKSWHTPDEEAIGPWTRRMGWLLDPEVPIVLKLALDEDDPPLRLKGFKDRIIQALYDRPEYYETGYSFDDWVTHLTIAESPADLLRLFEAFDIE